MNKQPQKLWWVYIVRCADGTLYCGATNDLKKRILAHNTGKGARYTRGRFPVSIVFRKRCQTKSMALMLEAHIKRIPRSKKLLLKSSNQDQLYK